MRRWASWISRSIWSVDRFTKRVEISTINVSNFIQAWRSAEVSDSLDSSFPPIVKSATRSAIDPRRPNDARSRAGSPRAPPAAVQRDRAEDQRYFHDEYVAATREFDAVQESDRDRGCEGDIAHGEQESHRHDVTGWKLQHPAEGKPEEHGHPMNAAAAEAVCLHSALNRSCCPTRT